VAKLVRANGGCLGVKRRRKTWQAAISLGELHAHFDPEISELPREGRIRWELKHLSTNRKRKQIVIPLLAESEKGTGQAESAFEKKLEMWFRVDPKSVVKLNWKVRP